MGESLSNLWSVGVYLEEVNLEQSYLGQWQHKIKTPNSGRIHLRQYMLPRDALRDVDASPHICQVRAHFEALLQDILLPHI